MLILIAGPYRSGTNDVNIDKIKELQFLIMDPHSDGDEVTFMTQKITKLKYSASTKF
jgi:hypothetical protein